MFFCTICIVDTPSFAISRTPGFGYPLREGIEVSLKCDVDSNPPSTPMWQKDDGEPPVSKCYTHVRTYTKQIINFCSNKSNSIYNSNKIVLIFFVYVFTTTKQIQQNGDGFLNFTQIRREHSGWYKCTSRHLNFQYSSIGYFLNIRCKYFFF